MDKSILDSKDTMLQKEFKSRDVERMRNLITKKYDDTTGLQIGYRKEQIEHKEGDVWEEDNKTWTIQNGIKMTVSRLDKLKLLLQTPLSCPICGKAMVKKELDKKMYMMYKKCFDCVIENETELKRQGQYHQHEKQFMEANIDGYINEMETIFEDFINTDINESVVTEAGDVERWVGGKLDKETITKEFQEYIETVRKIKTES
jgi:ssDNA-binding Zn-finger/Zn-ribbon topoisomerase 1